MTSSCGVLLFWKSQNTSQELCPRFVLLISCFFLCPVVLPITFCVTKLFEADTKWPPLSRRHFECIFLNENYIILIQIALEYVANRPVSTTLALIQIMATRRSGHYLNRWWSCLLTHIYATGSHDDVIKWKHFPRNWPFVRGILRSPVNSPHKGQWRGALMFSLICVWINDWVNSREAGDMRRHYAHYDSSVMYINS